MCIRDSIWITLYETVVGFVLGTLFGTLVAILLWWSKTLSRILDPYLVVLNALPKIALGPILIVWFGAVSYTHLDVYKRQLLRRWQSRGRSW